MKQETAEVLNLDVQKRPKAEPGAGRRMARLLPILGRGPRHGGPDAQRDRVGAARKHADEELEHAGKLITRIIQLGGTPC